MLSGVGTQAKNAKDSLAMIFRELEEKIAATPGFAVRKSLKAAGLNVKDGVSPQEIAGHMYGLMRAALDSKTYLETGKAFWQGHPSRVLNSKIEMQDARIPGVSKVQDLLHASDTFFRTFHTSANMYSLGIRRAREDGLTGLAAFEEGSNHALNPSEKMLKDSKNLADTALLVDTPSWLSGHLESMKSIRPHMRRGAQAGAFAANFILPFFRVTDRILFQAIRRSPLSFLDKNTREDFAAGGARRDIAIARTLYGSALLMYYWNQDENTGRGPRDYDKRQALEAGGWLPNSVNEGDKYVDASGVNLSLLPWDMHNAMAANVASIREAYETGKADEAETADKLAAATMALMSVLSSNSFAENLTTYLTPLSESETIDPGTAWAGVLGGAASSFVPAALRQYNQVYHDPMKRDTVGDKSFGDRVYGRVASAIPGLSDDLPQKYDRYGDPMVQGRSLSGMDNYQPIKDDEVSVELQRLERTTDSPVVDGGPRGGKFKHEGETIELTAEGRQEWQRVQGYYIRTWMAEEIQAPEWKILSDEEKIAIVKEVKTDAYNETKAYMLPLLGITEESE
jgi:hypothetical protein